MPGQANIDERYRLPQSFEAMLRCIAGRVASLAKYLGYRGKNYNNLYKWTQPSGGDTDSGMPNPADQLNRIITWALLDGRAPEDALAPLHWLCYQHDHACIPLPAPDGSRGLKELTRTYIEASKEFADIVEGFCDRIGVDGLVSPADAKYMTGQIYEAATHLLVLEQAIQGAVE